MTASVVADASPIIAFNGCNRLSLLRDLYGSIVVPLTVAVEISPSVSRLPDWIHVDRELPIAPIHLGRGLDPGGAAAIALAISTGAATVLIDDLAGRTPAEQLGLHDVRSLGIAIRAKRFGFATSARDLIDELVATGLYVSRPLYARALELADESE